MAGNQSRGLIAASKTKGWDPTIIQGTGESIANFDKDPGIVDRNHVGDLPGGSPLSWPDGYDTNITAPKVTFNAPDAGRENASRRTVNANPTPGR